MGLCKKSLKLFKVRVYEDHTILSVFQHAEGTNYSSRERIACLHLYLISVMACSAMYVNENFTNFFQTHETPFLEASKPEWRYKTAFFSETSEKICQTRSHI